MASKEMITKIILKGVTDPSLTKAFQNANKLSNNHINTLKKAGETAKKVAKLGVTAVAAGLGASIKSAIDYESAFTGVMKTVDETGTTTYEDLSKSIRNMAKEMPASASEIAGVAEIAGQLSIKADDIAKFTKTMIDLGETTNLSGEEGASAIAKYFNVTKTGMDKVDKFGATLVALGNNAATTEADIMNMASGIGASGSMVGLTNQEILAIATSLSSIGLEAARGGTAVSTILSTIDKQVALNGKTLGTWAEVAGMSASEFKTAWANDTMGTIQALFAGLGDAKKGGENLNVILDELGIKNIRTSDAMKRLTNASGVLTDMVNLANTEWDANTALTIEANKRYNTMASKLQILKNKITDAGITVGDKLMPIVDKVTEKLDKIDWEGVGTKICNVIQWVCDNSTTLMTIIGAIGGVIAGVKIAGIIKGIMTVIKVISTLSKTFGLIKVVMAALGGPVTIVIAIIGALVGAFIVLWNKSEGFRNFWIGLWEKIKTAASAVGGWLKNFFTVTVPNAFNATVTFIKNLPSNIWTWLVGVGQKIATWGSNLWTKAKQIGSNFVNGFVNFFKKLPYYVGFVIGFVIGKIIQFGQKLWNFATVTIPQFIGKVVSWFKQLPSKIWTWLVNTAQKVGAWGSNLWAKAKQIGSRVINAIITFFKQLPSKVWTWLKNTASKVASWGSQLASKGKAAAIKLFNAVVNKIKELPKKLMSLGKSIVQGLWNGIKNAKKWFTDKIKSFASGITDGIKSALGINSPSVVMEKLFKWVPIGAGNGIINNAKYAVNAVKNMGGKIANTASKIKPTIQTKVTTVGNKIKAFGNGGTVTRPQEAIVGDKPETIVPHGNTPRNRSLLMDAAKGVGHKIGGAIYHITFAPVIHGGSASENKQMLEEEYIKFKQMMDEYIKEKGALAY